MQSDLNPDPRPNPSEELSALPELPPLYPDTSEYGGYTGLEPTRYGDWEKKGRCIDF